MATEDAAKPLVLMISLNHTPFFDEMYGPLLAELRSKATLRRAEDAAAAIRLLAAEPRPLAALVTDAALARGENARAWDAVLEYVRRGGTSVIMGTFASFVRPGSVRPFFSKAGLPWDMGSYHRTAVVLNEGEVAAAAAAAAAAARLPPRYSQKAVFVKDVAPADAWYVTDGKSVVQSLVFAPTSADVAGESPVVFARVGRGRLGYLGDVNAEEESTAVMLAMCGLAG